MIIGNFTNEGTKFEGFITTLSGDLDCTLHPQERGADFTVCTSNGCELGAAWRKVTKAGTPYLSVRLDSPFLDAPVHCALFPGKTGFDLIWKRQADEE